VDEDVCICKDLVQGQEGWPCCKEEVHEAVVPPAGVNIPWLGGIGGWHKV
jgi:hypothetical protein